MQAGISVTSTVGDHGNGVSDAADAVRGHTYSLLGALLAQPPGHALLRLLDGIDTAQRDGATPAEFADSWQALRVAAQRADVNALNDEYHSLFVGLGRGEVMPYASWYLTGFLMDRPLAALRADLAALGIERRADVKEPEDHVAALCETMAMLCTSDATLDQQRVFFQAHVAPWVGDFFNDLQAAPSAAFYRALGRFAAQFVAFEARYLSMMV